MLPFTCYHNKLPSLFNALYVKDVPSRFTYRFLASLGFKSSKERDLYKFLVQMGFISNDGVPSSVYLAFKNSASPDSFVSVCAKTLYKDLLSLSFDLLVKENLVSVLRATYPNLTMNEIELISNTFYAINDYAPFIKKEPYSHVTIQDGSKRKSVNININLPETDNIRVYETIFKYLRDIINGN